MKMKMFLYSIKISEKTKLSCKTQSCNYPTPSTDQSTQYYLCFVLLVVVVDDVLL